MKGKSYYGLLISLIIIGISSFNFYQHKQEERLLEFEGYEITSIEERVEALYNEEKTDIVENITEDELEELDQIFLDLKEKDLHKENKRRISNMEVDFLMAREMNTIQEDIRALFDNKIVVSSAELTDIGRLKREIEAYSIRPDYYERNTELLEDGKQQLTDIREAEELVESLLDEEGNLLEGVTQEDIDEALEIIANIKNKEIRDTLTALLDGEIIEVEEEEDEDEEEEIEEEVEEVKEVDEPETTPTRPSRPRPNPRPTPAPRPTTPVENPDEDETVDPDEENTDDENTDDENLGTPPSDNGGEDTELTPEPEPESEPEPEPEPTPAPDPETDTEPGSDPKNPDNN